MISFKMDDGSRYDVEDMSPQYDSDGWIVINGKEKTVWLNPRHIVTITEVGDDQ